MVEYTFTCTGCFKFVFTFSNGYNSKTKNCVTWYNTPKKKKSEKYAMMSVHSSNMADYAAFVCVQRGSGQGWPSMSPAVIRLAIVFKFSSSSALCKLGLLNFCAWVFSSASSEHLLCPFSASVVSWVNVAIQILCRFSCTCGSFPHSYSVWEKIHESTIQYILFQTIGPLLALASSPSHA